MNVAARSGATVVCEHAPDPKRVCDDASHPVKLRDVNGNETMRIHSPSAGPYRDYNSQFRQRSGPAVGILSRGKFRGLLTCFWSEPRSHPLLEIDAIEAVCAVLDLSSSKPKDA